MIEATTRHAAATDAQAAVDRTRMVEEMSAVPAVVVDESETQMYLQHLRAEIERLSALFDTARFTRHLEAAFLTIHRRHQAGEAPQTFDVPLSGP